MQTVCECDCSKYPMNIQNLRGLNTRRYLKCNCLPKRKETEFHTVLQQREWQAADEWRNVGSLWLTMIKGTYEVTANIDCIGSVDVRLKCNEMVLAETSGADGEIEISAEAQCTQSNMLYDIYVEARGEGVIINTNCATVLEMNGIDPVLADDIVETDTPSRLHITLIQ